MTSWNYHDGKGLPSLWVWDVIDVTMERWVGIALNDSVDGVL